MIVKLRVIEKCKHIIPNLPSRIGNLGVFSFYGYKEEVGTLMQNLCHTSRAYYVGADKFNNFVKALTIPEYIQRSLRDGSLKQ